MATVTEPDVALPSPGDDMLSEQVTDWITNIIAFLEGSNIDENNVDLLGTDGLVGKSTAQTVTGLKTFEDQSAAAGGYRDGIVVAHNPSSGTAADADGVQVTFRGDDDGGNVTNYAKLIAEFEDVSDGSEDGAIVVKALVAGSEVEIIRFTGFGVSGVKGMKLGNIRLHDDTTNDVLRFNYGSDPASVTSGEIVLKG